MTITGKPEEEGKGATAGLAGTKGVCSVAGSDGSASELRTADESPNTSRNRLGFMRNGLAMGNWLSSPVIWNSCQTLARM